MDNCWVCLKKPKWEHCHGACRTCRDRLYRRWGVKWQDLARVLIEQGNRHQLLPGKRGRQTSAGLGGRGLVKAPSVTAQRFYDGEPVSSSPENIALREARKDPRKIVAVPVGNPMLGVTLYFEPYLDSEGIVRVRQLDQNAKGA